MSSSAAHDAMDSVVSIISPLNVSCEPDGTPLVTLLYVAFSQAEGRAAFSLVLRFF